MNNVSILDCTLRDGGRIINCEFSDRDIADIARELTDANINIVEMGFLRDRKQVDYQGNSTFFTSVEQIEAFIPGEKRNTEYVAFIDFNMYDFAELEECTGNSVTGIRFGFTKKQLVMQKQELLECMRIIKRQGYHLYIQGVNTPAYSDRELLELVDIVNEIRPYSFGIVDTYGSMYLNDIVHYFDLVDYNLDQSICIDIHSHNNLQLSFAFAQEIIARSEGKRKIILDATLEGMGKCAGNLNTELIADYLVRKKSYDYKLDNILDIIDNYLYKIKRRYSWGYSVPAFMAGIYKAHPNNIIYLTEKFRINTRDIKNIISMIDEDTRQRYDYNNIEQLYIKYNENQNSDAVCIQELTERIKGKKVLLLIPGHSLVTYSTRIEEYVAKNRPVIISVNFVSQFEESYVFWGNAKRYQLEGKRSRVSHKDILCTNVAKEKEDAYIVDYHRLICEGFKYFDNSSIMCLNLLDILDAAELTIAGFDGFDLNRKNNYIDASFINDLDAEEFDEVNEVIYAMLKQYFGKAADRRKISFLTPSRFEGALAGNE